MLVDLLEVEVVEVVVVAIVVNVILVGALGTPVENVGVEVVVAVEDVQGQEQDQDPQKEDEEGGHHPDHVADLETDLEEIVLHQEIGTGKDLLKGDLSPRRDHDLNLLKKNTLPHLSESPGKGQQMSIHNQKKGHNHVHVVDHDLLLFRMMNQNKQSKMEIHIVMKIDYIARTDALFAFFSYMICIFKEENIYIFWLPVIMFIILLKPTHFGGHV